MSATPDSTLANPEQRIADLQRQLVEREAELAECKAELAEALEQRTATAEVLQVINTSPGDLTPVFDAMLEKATSLCGAAFGLLFTWDGECFHPVAWRGISRELLAVLREPFRPQPGTLTWAIARGKNIVSNADLLETESYRNGIARVRALVEFGGARSHIGIALRKDDAVLGHLSIYRQEVRPFTDKQIALLQNFAAQAVIAMENARLLTETREALEQQTATAEVLQVINSSPGDLAPVFDAILEKALNLCGAAYGHVFRVEGDLGCAVAARGDSEFVEWLLKQGPIQLTPGGILHRMMQGERVVQIPDSTDTEGYRAGKAIRELIDRSGVRTTLGVALRNDSALLGAIFINRRKVRPFSDKVIALLESFAAQAVIAMENARLLTETREALEQQTATAEVLQVINGSPGDLAPVFDAMLEKASRLCEAPYGQLAIYDGEFFRFGAVHGDAPFAAEMRELGSLPPSVGVSWPRIVGGEDVVHVADLMDTDLYRSGHERTLKSVDTGGVRSLLSIALRKDGALLGTLSVYRQEVRPFSDKHIALLQNFAAQAVIAMENARLLTETREALEQQTATAEVLQVINSSPGDLAPVFDAMLEKALRLCDAAFGLLHTYDGERFRALAISGVSGSTAEAMREWVPDPGSALERIAHGDRIVHIPDVVDTEAYRSGVASRLQLVEMTGARTALWVALSKDDAPLGVFVIYRKEVRPFTDKQIALVQNFAAQAVIAMENARLLTETREALEQQTATAEVLQVINSSPGDLAPVFDAMLEKALRLCEAAYGNLLVFDGRSFSFASVQGEPDLVEHMRQRGPFEPTPGTALNSIVEGEDIAQIADLLKSHEYHSVPQFCELVDIGGYRSLLEFALRKDKALLGVIAIFRREARPFTDKQIALLQNFAAQAVIAMENARLLTETREALEQQTATAEVLQVINSSPGDLAPVFAAILEKAHTLCGAALGSFCLNDGERMPAVASRGYPDEHAALAREGLPTGGEFGKRLARGEITHIDLASLEAPSATARSAVEITGSRTYLAIPLRKDGALLGYLSAHRNEVRPFSDKQIALLQNFAAQAVIAIENARLLGELRQRTDQVAELNRGLETRVAEQVEELGRVGRLKRFLAPQLAELIVSQGDEKILESHRREIVVVFCDLRGYTAFTETAEPEEVLDFLREYHGALGPLVSQFEGTLDQFSGDGIMVFFNDPVPCPDPAERAVKMAVAMREAAGALIATWRRRGRELGFGAGIAQGYATLGLLSAHTKVRTGAGCGRLERSNAAP